MIFTLASEMEPVPVTYAVAYLRPHDKVRTNPIGPVVTVTEVDRSEDDPRLRVLHFAEMEFPLTRWENERLELISGIRRLTRPCASCRRLVSIHYDVVIHSVPHALYCARCGEFTD